MTRSSHIRRGAKIMSQSLSLGIDPFVYFSEKDINQRSRRTRNSHNSAWKPWEAFEGPQQKALDSLADVIGYGGQAGGGKTGLLLILATARHKDSVIFRREYPRLKDIIKKSRSLLRDSSARYNSTDKIWRDIPGDRTLEFGAVQYADDVEAWRGREHDLKAIDEATEFTREQIDFLIGWNRTTEEGQHCRSVLTFNPPSNIEGQWILRYFSPWLDDSYPTKTGRERAAPGELRWFVTAPIDKNDRDSDESTLRKKFAEQNLFLVELRENDGAKTVDLEFDPDGYYVGDRRFDSPEPVTIDSKLRYPKPRPVVLGEEQLVPRSRTFIPASLDDNPYLKDSGYRGVLQGFPEPLRSQLLYGDFSIKVESDSFAVLPYDWVKEAQKRWREHYRDIIPLTSVGVDVARGGSDRTVIVRKYEHWIDKPIVYPGSNTPNGDIVADYVVEAISGNSNVVINLDVIGIGSSPYDRLVSRGYPVNGLNGAEKTDEYETDRTKKIKFRNKRSYWWWKVREAIEPSREKDAIAIEIPPNEELLQELTAFRFFEVAKGVIAVESKADVRKRLQWSKSPDLADAFVYAFAENTINREGDILRGWLGN